MDITDGKRLTVISGAFGTGKTEIAINLALKLREAGVEKVFLVDLDIVNLFFRSRQKAYELKKKGIRVISSQEGMENADLPSLSPEIADSFAQEDSTVVFDLGGSELGATVLSRFHQEFIGQSYNHWLVVNPYRPFNEKNEDTLEMAEQIAVRARLPITGMIANPHLLDETTPDIIREGFAQVRKIDRYPLLYLSVMDSYLYSGLDREFDVPVMVIGKQMKQPWEEGGILISGKGD
ncbi:MAG: hypothetical protein PHW04_13190 [Candidatus Wallbacteria bacterium]|nr:hypothetical protein [Candidatus Wallbacteria bacterium]